MKKYNNNNKRKYFTFINFRQHKFYEELEHTYEIPQYNRDRYARSRMKLEKF